MRFATNFVFVLVTLTSVTARLGRVVHRKLVVNPPDTRFIVNSYVVLFDETVTNVTAKRNEIEGLPAFGDALVQTEYETALKGISVGNVTDALLNSILGDQQVMQVFPVRSMILHGSNDLLPHISSTSAISNLNLCLQDVLFNYRANVQYNPPTWGLDRIDERLLPMDKMYRTNFTGNGVTMFFLDSGIDLTHKEFTGRLAYCGFDGIPNSTYPCEDWSGHGTMMAGIAAGNTFGVAKKARIVSVKVGYKSGTLFSAVVGGLDYVLQQKLLYPTRPMVTAIALDAEDNEEFILGLLVNRLHDAGVFVAVAAGNDSIDACNDWTNRVPKVISVGASGATDKLWNETNYGPCVDIFAPGETVHVPWKLRKDGTKYNTIDGTSPAAAFVAGVGALYLHRNSQMTPANIGFFMKLTASKSVLNNGSDPASSGLWFNATKTPNLLLNIGSALRG